MGTGEPCNCLLWLAGLMEAEGTFLKPPPSSPNVPIVSCRMTDEDVVALVADWFEVSVQQYRRIPFKTEFSATVKGARAASVMRALRPYLGERRRAAIERSLSCHVPRPLKLSASNASEIRQRASHGASVSLLAREFEVARQTIYAVLAGRIHADKPPDERWALAPTAKTHHELCWLAGWLEGEGSFLAPPPSDRRRPRISASSCDRDVIERVAQSLNVTPQRAKDRRARARGWRPMYRVLCRGSHAMHVMRAIRPTMGARRREQIDVALQAVS
jgi:hypothetical protein